MGVAVLIQIAAAILGSFFFFSFFKGRYMEYMFVAKDPMSFLHFFLCSRVIKGGEGRNTVPGGKEQPLRFILNTFRDRAPLSWIGNKG